MIGSEINTDGFVHALLEVLTLGEPITARLHGDRIEMASRGEAITFTAEGATGRFRMVCARLAVVSAVAVATRRCSMAEALPYNSASGTKSSTVSSSS
jgi:hypothetical protein